MKRYSLKVLWLVLTLVSCGNALAFYSPATGRWLSRDPVGERGGANLYGFAANNPTKFTDYLGAFRQLYQDPESGLWGFVDSYDVYYLGARRVIACGETVPRYGAPLGQAPIAGLGGNSLEMVFGPTFGQGMNQLPGTVSMLAWGAGITGEMAAGLFFVIVPEPTLSKFGGGVLLADALDNVQGGFRGSETLFEQAVGSLPWMDAESKKAACCVKSYAMTILCFAAVPQANSPLRIGRFGNAAAETIVWNNGWRTLDGKFASPLGAGRSGAAAEQAVWDAFSQKPGWSVIEGRVSVRNAAGDLRVYDGAAVSPRGRVTGLEVKSGSATRTGAQSAFDSGVNTFNPAVGVGQNSGLQVGRSLLINVP